MLLPTTRRGFLKMAGAGAAVAVLGACTPKAPTAPPAAATKPAAAVQATAAKPAPKAPVTIQWGMYAYEPWILFLKEMMKRYKDEKDSNVTVEIIQAPWDQYWQKLEAQATAGTPINVSVVEPQFFIPWFKRDLLLDLQPRVDTIDKSIFYDKVVCSDLVNTQTWRHNCQSGGSALAAFPGNGTCWVVYLNMKLLKEAGLEYPKESWNWDDFKKYAVGLTKDKAGKNPGQSGFDKNNIVQWGLSNTWFGDQKNMKSFQWHAGGRRWSDDQETCGFTEAKSMEAIKYMVDLGVTLGCAPLSASFEGIAQPFLTGKIGMHLTGSWNVDPWGTDLTDWEFDIQRLPVGPGGENSRFSHTGYGNSLAVFKKASNPDTTWEVFKWALMTKEGSAYFGRAGVPTVKAAGEDKEWLDRPNGKHLPKHREIQLVCMAKEPGNSLLEPIGLADAGMLLVIGNEMPNLSLGRATPEQWANTVCAGIKAAVEKAKTQ